jgi:hypothetical protein
MAGQPIIATTNAARIALASDYRTLTHEEWVAEGTRLFGPDTMQWRFVCPVCGYIATGNEWLAAGAPAGAIGFSCVGRWTGGRGAFEGNGPGPCNYAGGGLFHLNPVRVTNVGARGAQGARQRLLPA